MCGFPHGRHCRQPRRPAAARCTSVAGRVRERPDPRQTAIGSTGGPPRGRNPLWRQGGRGRTSVCVGRRMGVSVGPRGRRSQRSEQVRADVPAGGAEPLPAVPEGRGQPAHGAYASGRRRLRRVRATGFTSEKTGLPRRRRYRHPPATSPWVISTSRRRSPERCRPTTPARRSRWTSARLDKRRPSSS